MHALSINLFIKPSVSGLTSVKNPKFIKTTSHIYANVVS